MQDSWARRSCNSTSCMLMNADTVIIFKRSSPVLLAPPLLWVPFLLLWYKHHDRKPLLKELILTFGSQGRVCDGSGGMEPGTGSWDILSWTTNRKEEGKLEVGQGSGFCPQWHTSSSKTVSCPSFTKQRRPSFQIPAPIGVTSSSTPDMVLIWVFGIFSGCPSSV